MLKIRAAIIGYGNIGRFTLELLRRLLISKSLAWFAATLQKETIFPLKFL